MSTNNIIIIAGLVTLLFVINIICEQTLTNTTENSIKNKTLQNFKYDSLCSLLPQIIPNSSVTLTSKYHCPSSTTPVDSSKVIDERKQSLKKQLINYIRNSKQQQISNYNPFMFNKILINRKNGQLYKVIPTFKKLKKQSSSSSSSPSSSPSSLNNDENIDRSTHESGQFLESYPSSSSLQNINSYADYEEKNSPVTSGIQNPSIWDLIPSFDDLDSAGSAALYNSKPTTQPIPEMPFYSFPVPYPMLRYPVYNAYNPNSNTTTPVTPKASPETSRPDLSAIENMGLSHIPLNRLDIGTGIGSLLAMNTAGQARFVIFKNLGPYGWAMLLIFILVAPLILGLAFIPVMLKSMIFLLQIARNSDAFHPLLSQFDSAGARTIAANCTSFNAHP